MSVSSGSNRIFTKLDSIPGLRYTISPLLSFLRILLAVSSGSMPNYSTVLITSFSASRIPRKISSSTNIGQELTLIFGIWCFFSSSSFKIQLQISGKSSILRFVFPLQNPLHRENSLSQLSEPNVEG